MNPTLDDFIQPLILLCETVISLIVQASFIIVGIFCFLQLKVILRDADIEMRRSKPEKILGNGASGTKLGDV